MWSGTLAGRVQTEAELLTSGVSLVGVTLVPKEDGGASGALAGSVVAHLDDADGTDGRLHEVADGGLGDVRGKVRDDDLASVGSESLGSSGGGSGVVAAALARLAGGTAARVTRTRAARRGAGSGLAGTTTARSATASTATTGAGLDEL